MGLGELSTDTPVLCTVGWLYLGRAESRKLEHASVARTNWIPRNTLQVRGWPTFTDSSPPAVNCECEGAFQCIFEFCKYWYDSTWASACDTRATRDSIIISHASQPATSNINTATAKYERIKNSTSTQLAIAVRVKSNKYIHSIHILIY